MHYLLTFLLAILTMSAPQNEKTDSLVRLLSAQSAQLMQQDGHDIRKVIGPARFLHNDTYLLCDTAYWDVDNKIIKAFSNVQILQDETVLSSDKLDYYIEENLAQFRGSIVQLQDKDGNTLRTRHLDYNTKDSVAVFSLGGSMRDKDGQIIESLKGTYDSKIKTFTFDLEVNMFSDSVFVSTAFLEYQSNTGKAYFNNGVNVWKEEKMLSSNNGYYDSSDSTFFFSDNVHALSDEQEGWSDSLFFFRPSQNILLLGNAQVVDTSRRVAALGDYMFYEDSVSTITIEKNAAIIAELDQGGQLDTAYVGADTIRYWTRKKCDIPEQLVADAEKRLTDLSGDPVTAYRKKAAEDAAEAAKKKAAEEAEKNPNKPPVQPQASSGVNESGGPADGGKKGRPKQNIVPEGEKLSLADTLSSPQTVDADELLPSGITAPSDSSALATDTLLTSNDSLASSADTLQASSDSLASSAVKSPVLDKSLALSADNMGTPTDSLPPAPSDTVTVDSLAVAEAVQLDTTEIGFALALGHVRMFKSDLQMRCDSLTYTDLDSLARLFKDPIIWNENNRQYSADSLSIIIKDKRMERASLMSNAFIVIQEDSLLFDQIRSTEMMAYFDSTSALSRFDALGSATAVFYLEENDALATVNKVESKMLSAVFKDGEIEKIYYFDSPKNNAFPTVQLPAEDRQMKGFRWNPEIRPKGREDITPLVPKESERKRYEAYSPPKYVQTAIYFPGYMADIYNQIAVRDSLRAAREQAREEMKRMREAEIAALDSLVAGTDSLSVVGDSLAVEGPQLDSLAAPSDSLGVVADSLSISSEIKEPTAAELREQRRREKQEAREAKWAVLDARDAAKASAKAQKKLEKQRRKALKLVKAAEKEAARDQKKLDRYIRRYQKRKGVLPDSVEKPPLENEAPPELVENMSGGNVNQSMQTETQDSE